LKKGTGYFFGYIGLCGSLGLFGLSQKRTSNPSATFSTLLTSFLSQFLKFPEEVFLSLSSIHFSGFQSIFPTPRKPGRSTYHKTFSLNFSDNSWPLENR
jgi:hypothetical protein